MLTLIAGLILWTLAHLSKLTFSGLRASVAGTIGNGGATAVVALLLVGSIYLMSQGYAATDATPLWTLPGWMNHIAVLLMLPAFIFTFGNTPGNILMANMRHPMLTGFKIWAVLHILVNGEPRSLILFGGLLAWAVFIMILLNKRDGKGPLPEAASAALPRFAPVIIGTIVWAVFVFWAHEWLFGVSPLG